MVKLHVPCIGMSLSTPHEVTKDQEVDLGPAFACFDFNPPHITHES